MKCLWMSVTFAPVASSSSAMDPMTRTSSPSSEAHTGMGVPQYRLREMDQSCAPSSQLWNRFSCTYEGTHRVLALFARSFSLMLSTFTKNDPTAL